MPGSLNVENLNKSFLVNKEIVNVLDNINLTIEASEFVVIVGHSGCGKSTLLKIITGLEKADSGSVTKNGEIISEPGVDRGMIFQEHRLFP